MQWPAGLLGSEGSLYTRSRVTAWGRGYKIPTIAGTLTSGTSMIARFIFELPTSINIRPSDSLPPLSITYKNTPCLVYAPYQLSHSGQGPTDTPAPDVLYVDGEVTYLANVLQVDVMGDFDRSEKSKVGPEYDIALEAAQKMVELFRSLVRSPFMAPPDKRLGWRVRYLKDDGTEFEYTAGLVRGRGTHIMLQGERAWLSPEIWSALSLEARDAVPQSDALMLDALNLLLMRHMGAAIVMAYTAIEVRIGTALELLAKRNPGIIGTSFWAWLNNRRNEPSVEDELTDILNMLSGRSLKQESALWTAYCELRKARNSFAHEGNPVLPGGAGVTSQKALELLSSAQQIVDWIEIGLLASERRPVVASPDRTTQLMLTIPTSAGAGQ